MPSFDLRRVILVACGSVFFLSSSMPTLAQEKITAAPLPASTPAPTAAKLPIVTQLDIAGLRKALTPSGKPLLVNFWATWCDPCREEFPDLVKLDAEYKGKIDFITISIDEVAEINRDVPKFLAGMKAEMPAYLLAAEDDDVAIGVVSKDFTGAMPFTILYDSGGKQTYFRQGKVRLETVRAELDKLLRPAAAPGR